MNVFKLEWTNACDICDIFYQDDFKQVFYIDSDKNRMCGALSEPQYPLEEEAITNGDGVEIPIFQRLEKRYQLSFLANEYMLDALTMLPMHSDVTLTDPDGNSSLIYDIQVTPGTWSGRFIPVVVSFVTHRFVKTKRCRNMTIALPV